jgi:hypothetical protein
MLSAITTNAGGNEQDVPKNLNQPQTSSTPIHRVQTTGGKMTMLGGDGFG